MNDYWDTSHDAELIAIRLERLNDLVEKLIEVGERLANSSRGPDC
jgi:hypothetical protein